MNFAKSDKGQKLYTKAKSLISGGNMLLSKRPEMFLPEQWPSYFTKTKGCKVWDLDGREFTDMLMTVGTNTLGYNCPAVDERVKLVIEEGNMSSLNAPEEVELAERLIELHSWAKMAKFSRSGGEANAIAIRIARAASGKDNVAICGYHGWHDWYLATNLVGDDNLNDHLLPGLEPRGVPACLRETIFPFKYNDYQTLESLVKKKNIGVIKMEVYRNKEPEENFLEKVRKLATENNVVLIFDECTSGFRKTFGGLHKFFKVEPDMAMLGKALGNGYAINAVIGREEIMQAAQTTFISSTFWTERIGSVAALATLEVMEHEKSWDEITKIGGYFQAKLSGLAKEFELPMVINGLEALTTFSFDSPNSLAYKTFLTQEMLKKGYLAGSSFYASISHSIEIVDEFFAALAPVLTVLKECEAGRDIMTLLDGPVCHGGFKRLN
jgi:glutamate-1-semialdehyde 2,1-aminomutase